MPNLSATPVAIGIDLGGTAIKGGLVTASGEVLSKGHTLTEADGGPDHVIARIAGQIELFKAEAESRGFIVSRVGVGAPGILSHKKGVVIAPPNLPGWRNVPIVKRLADASGLQVNLENDANNAAYAEFIRGAGRGSSNMVLLTIGTGIGGGVILDGRLFRGAFENAGELGHTIVQAGGRLCGCGQRGCLEAHASATSLTARAVELIERGRPSTLAEILRERGALDARDIATAVAAGDLTALEAWNETCRFLAIACINIQHAFNPERIVFAGGLSETGPLLKDAIAAAYRDEASRILGDPPEIRLAELGNDAGFVGAALSAFAEA